MKNGIDLRTDAEISRDQKHQRICADFTALSNQNEDAKPGRIAAAIAREYGMSVPGVINVLVANRLYRKGARKARKTN